MKSTRSAIATESSHEAPRRRDVAIITPNTASAISVGTAGTAFRPNAAATSLNASAASQPWQT